jgi:O-antigen/teichoic acid export membrane protein
MTMRERRPLGGLASRWPVAANVGYLLSSSLLAGALLYVVNIHLARTLSVADFGSLNYLLNFGIIAFQVSELGLNIQIQRDAAHAGGSARSYFPAALWVRIVVSVVTLVLAFPLILALPDTGDFSALAVLLLLTSTALDAVSQSLVSRLNGNENMGRTAAVNMARVATLAVLIYALAGSQNLLLISVVYTGASLARLVVAVFFVREDLKASTSCRSMKSFAIVKSSWPYGIIGLFSVVSARIEITFLGTMLDQTAVGLYSIAMMVMTAGSMASAAYVQSVWPSLVRSTSDASSFRSSYLRALWVPFGGALTIGILGWIYAEPLVTLVFTVRYADAVDSVRVMCVATGTMFLVALAGAALNASNLPRFAMAYAGGVACLKLVLCWLAIPEYGAVGAAWTTAISYGLGFCILHIVNTNFSPRDADR